MGARLVKYSKSPHNITRGGTTIHLGTLQYYRELDPAFSISDPGEGTHHLSFRPGLSFTMTDELSDQIFGGSIKGVGGPIEVIANEGAQFKTILHNCYLFCVTRCTTECPPSLAEARSFDQQYDSMYEIADPDRFKRLVAESILEKLSLMHLAPQSLRAVLALPLKELVFQLQIIDRPVEYVELREKHIANEDDLHKMESLPKALDRALFTKEKRDEHQREFRFAFIVSHPRLGMLSVRPEPLILPASPAATVCAFGALSGRGDS